MGKRRHYEWANQTVIGKAYRLTAGEVGGRLMSLGLKGEDFQPTDEAKTKGLVRQYGEYDGNPAFGWHYERTTELLFGSWHNMRESLCMLRESNATQKVWGELCERRAAINAKDKANVIEWLAVATKIKRWVIEGLWKCETLGEYRAKWELFVRQSKG